MSTFLHWQVQVLINFDSFLTNLSYFPQEIRV